MNESWKAIDGFFGYYEVSDFGNVRSIRSGMLLSPILEPNGYLRVNLSVNGNVKKCSVHRLVATAFHEKPVGKNFVDHIDYQRTNNKANNLRWATNVENQRHSACKRIGLRNKSSKRVKDMSTGVIYSAYQAALKSGYCRAYFSKMMNGHVENKTQFVFV